MKLVRRRCGNPALRKLVASRTVLIWRKRADCFRYRDWDPVGPGPRRLAKPIWKPKLWLALVIGRLVLPIWDIRRGRFKRQSWHVISAAYMWIYPLWQRLLLHPDSYPKTDSKLDLCLWESNGERCICWAAQCENSYYIYTYTRWRDGMSTASVLSDGRNYNDSNCNTICTSI